jgi:hypothetical protein
MQYFLGYSSFVNEMPFDASLFVDIRKRLRMEVIQAMNEKIILLKTQMDKGKDSPPDDKGDGKPQGNGESPTTEKTTPENRGRLLMDATAWPQDIAYPTDLDLLSQSREITERLIDLLYDAKRHSQKPSTYRKVARKRYLQTAQKKNKSKKAIRRAVRGQLGYLGRNICSIPIEGKLGQAKPDMV